MGSKLTTWIFVAALVGIAAGWAGRRRHPHRRLPRRERAAA
jgi:hypothetical protein